MLKIVFTSEDNENSMFGIEEFPISADYRNASFQYRCFLQTRSYPGSKAIQKEETLSSGLINQKAVNPTAFSCV